MIPPGTKQSFEQALSEIVEAFRRGNLSLFLGAGASAPAGLPTAFELLSRLREIDSTSSHIDQHCENLSHAAELCSEPEQKKQWFETTVAKILREEEERFKRTRFPSSTHQILVNLPGSVEIITTNWDQLVELHAEHYGQPLSVIWLDDHPPSKEGKISSLQLLKIHITRAGHLIAAEKDLMSYRKQFPHWDEYLRWVLANRTVLFVGHGLADDWLRLSIVEEGIGTGKAYAVDPNPDVVKYQIWANRGVNYLKGPEDGFMDAHQFFNKVAEATGTTVSIGWHQKANLRTLEEHIRSRSQTPVLAGDLFSELPSGRLYKRPSVSRIADVLSSAGGRWVLVAGPAGSGKSVSAALASLGWQVGQRKLPQVYYVNAADLSDAAALATEIEGLARRDVLILDDMHRKPDPSIELLMTLLPSAYCNVILVTRPGLLPRLSQLALPSTRSWEEIRIDPDEEKTEIIKHRLNARGIYATDEVIAQFTALFPGDLVALAAAIDSWDGQEPVRRELAGGAVMHSLEQIDARLSSEGFDKGVQAIVITSAFWRYELTVARQFLAQMGIPTATVDKLIERGDFIERPSAILNGQRVELGAAFHSNTALLYLMAVAPKVQNLPESWVQRQWPASGEDLSYQMLTKAIISGYLQAEGAHDYFVYQGYRQAYVDLLQAVLGQLQQAGPLAAKLLIGLGNAYRRLGSADFARAKRYLKKARQIIEEDAGRTAEIDELRGRLSYEEGYLLYLQNKFEEAARKFEQSYQEEFRDSVKARRARFGMMSRLQQGVSLWRAGNPQEAERIIDACVEWYKDPKTAAEWRFRANSLAHKAQLLIDGCKFKEAKTLLEQAENARRESGERSAVSTSTAGIQGWLSLESGDTAQAEASLRLAIETARRTEEPEGEARWHWLLGQAVERMNQYTEAKGWYRSALLQCDRGMDNQSWQRRAREGLSRLTRLPGGRKS